jgi:hypothetical protein
MPPVFLPPSLPTGQLCMLSMAIFKGRIRIEALSSLSSDSYLATVQRNFLSTKVVFVGFIPFQEVKFFFASQDTGLDA